MRTPTAQEMQAYDKAFEFISKEAKGFYKGIAYAFMNKKGRSTELGAILRKIYRAGTVEMFPDGFGFEVPTIGAVLNADSAGYDLQILDRTGRRARYITVDFDRLLRDKQYESRLMMKPATIKFLTDLAAKL